MEQTRGLTSAEMGRYLVHWADLAVSHQPQYPVLSESAEEVRETHSTTQSSD